MSISQELQAARLRLAKERPYLASALWALNPVSKPGLGTMAVDMYWRLYYDPDALAQWPVEVTEGVLYHEICHLLRNHADRMKNFNPSLSNIAADAEINDDLLLEGVKLPTPHLTPESIGQPNNLLAEEYYYALEDKQKSSNEQKESDEDPNSTKEKESAQKQKNNRKPNSRQESKANQEQGSNPESKTNQNRSSSNLEKESSNSNPQPMPGSGSCGSCATGQMAPWEDEQPGKGSSSGVSQIQAELIRRDVAGQIREHTRGQGRAPGHLARWAEDTLNPKVDWRKQLAAAVRYAAADTAGATDYSYRRPSRRQGQVGKGDVIFPSMRRPVPSVAVVADTSASMSENMLAQALAEISAILKSLGHKEGVHVLAVDQTVQFCRKVFRSEQIELTGGGGTDMGIGLEAAARLRPLPQVGIVITDGQTSWPDRPPRGMKVIVVLSGDGKAPIWASVIKISA